MPADSTADEGAGGGAFPVIDGTADGGAGHTAAPAATNDRARVRRDAGGEFHQNEQKDDETSEKGHGLKRLG